MRIIIASIVAVLLTAAPAAAEDVPATPSPNPTVAEGVQVPDFATRAWVVVDAQSGDVLAGQSFDEQRPMASTIKTLTALTLLPRLQYDSTYEARALETLTEGMHVGVLAGAKYTVSQLFHGMLMRSGNDAAVALADAYGYQRTITAMNEEAARIGASRTVAKSPNGLDQPGQVTTAADLAQIYRVAIQDPRLREILTAREFEFPAQPPTDPTEAATTFTIYNHDTLLNNAYPGFLGGKSGFTSQAGRTYVAGAEQNGRRLVVALLGIGGGTTATARQVLDWAFANVDQLQPVGTLPAIPDPAQIQPEPAGSAADPQDVAPPPAQPQAQMVVDQALATVSDMTAGLPPSPTADEIATTVQDATEQAAQYAGLAGSEGLDPQALVQAAQDAAASAAGTQAEGVSTTTGVAADMQVGGYAQSPYVEAAPQSAPPPPRGFFSTLVTGLFKAVMWTLLLLGVAVVMLRIRAVRRQKRRRQAYEEAMRRRADRSPAEDATRRQVPSRTA